MEVLCFIAHTGQAHCILLFRMRLPHACICFHHFCNPAWPPLSCMQSQTSLHCPFMMMACVFHPLFLRFMQPFPFSFLGLSALHAMIALFYLSLFSLYHAKRYCYLFFRPVSTSPFFLIPGLLSSCHLRGFM